MATRIDVDGTLTDCGTTLEEMQAGVGGYIEPVRMASRPNQVMYANEEGLMHGLPYNLTASLIAGADIVGPVVLLSIDETKAEES